MRAVVDLEGDGYEDDCTRIWCAGVYDIDTNAVHCYTDTGEIRDLVLGLDLCIGHNWLGYDLPVLERLTGCTFPSDPVKVCDTFELSMTLNPNRLHSVEDWAARLGVPGKVQVDDWKLGPIELYQARAVQDVRIEFLIYKALLKEMNVSDWSEIWNGDI